MKKNKRKIFVTEYDHKRLTDLIERSTNSGSRDRTDLEELAAELENAKIVAPKRIPPDVVTMNSTVRVRDLENGKEYTYTLVFPDEADPAEGMISIVAPIGTALLGYACGDTIDWHVPSGTRRLKVVDLVYQPEAAGDYDL